MDKEEMRCGACNMPFKESDEIVYCPDCGTPIHRECWDKDKKCPNEDKHNTGFEWTASPSEKRESTGKVGSDADFVCDVCGEELKPNDFIVVCPECGTPIHKECWDREHKCPNEARHIDDYDWNEEHRKSYAPPPMEKNTAVFNSVSEFFGEINRNPLKSGETGEELTCCGVKQSELIAFLGSEKISTPRLFVTFMNMANSKRKVSFNIFSGLFFPLYFFYRRMMGPGIILSLISIILSPIIIFVFKDYSVFMSNSANALAQTLAAYSYNMLPVAYALQFACILFTDYFYMKWCVRKILTIREICKDMPEEEYYRILGTKGKPSFLSAVIGFIIFALTVFAAGYFIN